jgi:hypothetical protein
MVDDNYDNATEVGLSKMMMLIMSTVPFVANIMDPPCLNVS